MFMKYSFFAEKLAEGKDIGNRLVDLSPFYLYFMTLFKKVLHVEWTSVKAIQSFVGALNCLLLYALGARVFRKEVGFLGAMIFALYGNLIILESTLEPTVFVLMFNLLCIYFLFRTQENLNASRPCGAFMVAAAFFTGLSIITKPTALLLLPLGASWIVFFVHRDVLIGKRLKVAFIFCCLALGVVMPVSVRNYVKLNDFVLVTADGGKVFFHGNGKGATALEGTGLPDEGFAEEGMDEPDHAHVLYRKTASQLSGRELSPSESSKFWFKRTLRKIKSDLGAYARLEVKKFVYFFNDYEMHYIASAYKEYKEALSFPFVRYGMIASLGLLGMTLSVQRFRHLFLIYGMVGLYLVSGLLFLVQARYRTPAVPYLCLFAGYSIWAVGRMAVEKRFSALAGALILAGIFFTATHFTFRDEIQKVDQWQKATKMHYQAGARPLFHAGKYEEAIAASNQCLMIIPDFSPAYNLRGRSLAILGRYDEALADFEKVISISPNFSAGYKNAGFLYLLQDDRMKAKAYLTKAQEIVPDDPKVREALNQLERDKDA